MSSEFGSKVRTTVFGESHGSAIGVVVDGLPAGEAIDMERLLVFMARRRPGKSAISTARAESDAPRLLSGVTGGRTNGAPLCAVIENSDQRSGDYAAFADKPRPSHADYAAYCKWGGAADIRGGGHFSGRLTAPLCAAGGIALQILARRGIYIGSHLASVAGIEDEGFPLAPAAELFESIGKKELPVISDAQGEKMREAILKAAREGDSVGGVIECAATGFPAGLGAPMFGGIENRLAAAIFGIPAVKGVEFGGGFALSAMRGSAANDPFAISPEGVITTTSNNSGGIQGGISNAMPIVLRAAIKPTPSIAAEQKTVSLSEGRDVCLSIAGRHDPCIAHRAAPVVEAVTALVLLDILLED